MPAGSLALVNCKVYVRFNPTVVARALVASRGKVLYVGDEEKALKVARLIGAEVSDLGGNVVLPGFVDAHMHPDSLGISMNSLDLRGVTSIDELKRRLRDYAEQRREAKWLLGRGWDQELFTERRWPTKEDLDEVVSDRPVLLERVCSHAAVLNTKALEVLGYPKRKELFEFGPDGKATGIVKGEAIKRAEGSAPLSRGAGSLHPRRSSRGRLARRYNYLLRRVRR